MALMEMRVPSTVRPRRKRRTNSSSTRQTCGLFGRVTFRKAATFEDGNTKEASIGRAHDLITGHIAVGRRPRRVAVDLKRLRVPEAIERQRSSPNATARTPGTCSTSRW